MVFTSRGFQPGSFGYSAFTAVAALFIVGSTTVFAALLVFEVRVGVSIWLSCSSLHQVSLAGWWQCRVQHSLHVDKAITVELNHFQVHVKGPPCCCTFVQPLLATRCIDPSSSAQSTTFLGKLKLKPWRATYARCPNPRRRGDTKEASELAEALVRAQQCSICACIV
jgi:hypothetical protein